MVRQKAVGVGAFNFAFKAPSLLSWHYTATAESWHVTRPTVYFTTPRSSHIMSSMMTSMSLWQEWQRTVLVAVVACWRRHWKSEYAWWRSWHESDGRRAICYIIWCSFIKCLQQFCHEMVSCAMWPKVRWHHWHVSERLKHGNVHGYWCKRGPASSESSL